MITGERTQDIIVATTIIIALVSSAFMVGNAMYYSGSYALIGELEVTMNAPVVTGIDPANESTFPVVALSFILQTESQFEGNVRIPFMGASVVLNDDSLSYMAFAWVVPYEQQPLYSGYNLTVQLARTSNTEEDRQTILDAYDLGVWNWTVTFRFYFIVFDEPGSITWIFKSFQTTDVVIS